jgi:hypothetical protein
MKLSKPNENNPPLIDGNFSSLRTRRNSEVLAPKDMAIFCPPFDLTTSIYLTIFPALDCRYNFNKKCETQLIAGLYEN